jgi:hypothetical protein
MHINMKKFCNVIIDAQADLGNAHWALIAYIIQTSGAGVQVKLFRTGVLSMGHLTAKSGAELIAIRTGLAATSIYVHTPHVLNTSRHQRGTLVMCPSPRRVYR